MKISKKNPLLGAHMSIAGGAVNALIAGESIDCTAIQIFTASNRQWSNKLLPQEEVKKFLDYKKTSSIESVISHASYLVNLGSPKSDIAAKSYEALKAEMLRCNQLQIPAVVIHPGSCLESDRTTCLNQIAVALSQLLDEVPTCEILLENSAGQGSSVCTTFEELAFLRKQITHQKRIGICFDTCHAFVAGYDFTTSGGYKKMWELFDSTLGLEHLKAIHLNDSAKPCCSYVDRHIAIGKGKIGLEAFKFIMNDPKLASIPKILETPKEKDLKEDVINLTALKNLID